MDARPRKPATIRNWTETNDIAWRMLCNGSDGVLVERGEAWAPAIARVAGWVLADSGYGLPKGYDSESWDAVTRAVAGRASCAIDGKVQTREGRRPVDWIPAEPRLPTYEELVKAEWENVPVFE